MLGPGQAYGPVTGGIPAGQGSRPVLALLPALKATPCRAWPPAPHPEGGISGFSFQAAGRWVLLLGDGGLSWRGGWGAQRNWGWLRGIGHLQQAQVLSCAA